MNISIKIKSGTGGYFDYDGCPYLIKTIKVPNFPIPRIGETLELYEPNDDGKQNRTGQTLCEYHQYLVTDVRYWINDDNNFGTDVYVVPIGRKI